MIAHPTDYIQPQRVGHQDRMRALLETQGRIIIETQKILPKRKLKTKNNKVMVNSWEKHKLLERKGKEMSPTYMDSVVNHTYKVCEVTML